MATEPFWGTWKIAEVVPESSHSEVFLLEGMRMLKLFVGRYPVVTSVCDIQESSSPSKRMGMLSGVSLKILTVFPFLNVTPMR